MANIGTTNVPGIVWGANGPVAPSAAAVLAGVQADINAAFGNVLTYTLTTPQGQIASSEAAVVFNTNSLMVYYANQVDPALNSGRFQDGVARIYFLERTPSQPTILQIECSGLADVVIPVGALVVDPAENLYAATDGGTISAGGVVTLAFTASIPGPTPVPATVKIYQTIPGWDTVVVTDGVPGNDVETRAQFEARRQQSVAKNSIGSLPAVLGSVLSVDGVLDAYVTENDTNSPLTIGGFTLAAHSLYVAVSGGDPDEVATAIWLKKAPGCNYNGNTTVTVFDRNSGYSEPFPEYDVSFEIPSALPIVLTVQMPDGPQVPSDALAQIQAAVINAFDGVDGGPRARIGSIIYASRFSSPISLLGSWATQIISIKVGSANTAGAIFEGHVSGTTLTATRIVSGTIAVGQTLFGLGVTTGTTIDGLISGSGGVGTYLISQTQTVAGATFTGTGSGTNLTVTAVTGTIGIGDTIAGTGVPAGTTIVSQTSGTTGGAGVYVTSGATTASSAAIVAGVRITGVASDQNYVQVQIDQEPTIAAPDIYLDLV